MPVDGTKQWISVRGTDLRNPILLVLHGGPAEPETPAAWTFQPPWEDYFTVVEWSQRGTGKAYEANTPAQMAPGMTIEGMTHDAAELVRYLRQRFHKRRIFVRGHSWGTVLGVRLAQRHPDWPYAYSRVGQVVKMREQEPLVYRFTLHQALIHHNAEAIRQLLALAPYPSKALTLARMQVRSRWEMYYGGGVGQARLRMRFRYLAVVARPLSTRPERDRNRRSFLSEVSLRTDAEHQS